jgi:hypothetical protein
MALIVLVSAAQKAVVENMFSVVAPGGAVTGTAVVRQPELED